MKSPYLQIPGIKIPSLKLIAAAPNLLDACERVSAILDILYEESDWESAIDDTHIDLVHDDLYEFCQVMDRLNSRPRS